MKRRRYAAVAGVAMAAAMAVVVSGAPGSIAATERAGKGTQVQVGGVTTRADTDAVAARFQLVTPTRVLDTRIGTGGITGPLRAGQTVTLDLSAIVPADATSVVLNVTGVDPTANTFITVWPTGEARPISSNLNLVPGQNRPNAAVVMVPPDRRLNLFNNAGNTHLVADLTGMYTTSSLDGFFPLATPERALDTRFSGNGSPVGQGQIRTIDLSGIVPENATAVTFNLTGTSPTATTYVTAWPAGTARPITSNLNLSPGQTAPNQVTMALGAGQQLSLFNHAGSTHLIVDVNGYYVPNVGSAYFAISPERILDTRPGQGLTPDVYIYMEFVGEGVSSLTAVTINLTGTNQSLSQHVTTWPGNFPEPNTSSLNLVPGQDAANLVTTGLITNIDGNKEFWTVNSRGYVDLVMDWAGYFATTS